VKTLLLTQQEVRSLIQMDRAVKAVEDAFAAHGRGETIMPPKAYVDLPHHHGDFRAMPAYFAGSVGVKWVNAHPENPSRHGLPAIMGIYILSDPATAAPLAIMDATLLTSVRTGAAAAVATRHLAVPDPKSLGVLGCGAQSRHIIEAHRELWPSIDVRCADINRLAAESLADAFDGEAVSMEDVAKCDVLCTVTPSRMPLVRRAWVPDGVHINAMGADAHGKQELDPAILKDAYIFLDDFDQAVASGEVNVPLEKGQLTLDQIVGTLGEVVAGRKAGRGDARITVFDSTGLAIQDAALARAIYETARERGTGQAVEIIP
jgi:ornithine cyclodeaminase/alanine dehydrogenase